MNPSDVRKKEHPARRLSTLYVEDIDVRLNKVQENCDNDIYIYIDIHTYTHTFDHTKMQNYQR